MLAPTMTAPELSTTEIVTATGFCAQTVETARNVARAAATLGLRRSTPMIAFHPHHGIRITCLSLMQFFEQLLDGLPATGNSQLRSNLIQRNQDKGALIQPRMRKLEPRISDHEIVY